MLVNLLKKAMLNLVSEKVKAIFINYSNYYKNIDNYINYQRQSLNDLKFVANEEESLIN